MARKRNRIANVSSDNLLLTSNSSNDAASSNNKSTSNSIPSSTSNAEMTSVSSRHNKKKESVSFLKAVVFLLVLVMLVLGHIISTRTENSRVSQLVNELTLLSQEKKASLIHARLVSDSSLYFLPLEGAGSILSKHSLLDLHDSSDALPSLIEKSFLQDAHKTLFSSSDFASAL